MYDRSIFDITCSKDCRIVTHRTAEIKNELLTEYGVKNI